MSPNDHAGRIHKHAFVVSTAVLLAVCLIAVAARFYIRLRVQKQLSIDDGFLVVSLCCLISAMGILYSVTVEKMYLSEALTLGLSNAYLPSDFLQQAFDFQKWITVTLMLTWCAIMAVKFSFLFLFRKLIDLIRPLIIYWWVVTVYNVAVLGYGVSVYYLACPHYYSMEALECASGSGRKRTLSYAVAQTVLDLAGDFMSKQLVVRMVIAKSTPVLYIPVRLIWKVQIRWTQKAALAMSLCLTVVMIIVTIIRVSGLLLGDKVDAVWESYWLILNAEVGIIMTAVTAFRTFFVARSKHRRGQSPGERTHWYDRSKRLLQRTFSLSRWRSKSGEQYSRKYEAQQNNQHVFMETLPNVPHAHMTGVRTFIDAQGRTMNDSRIMQSQITQEDDEIWPLHKSEHNGHGIRVQHDLSSHAIRVPDVEGAELRYHSVGAPLQRPHGPGHPAQS